MYVCGTSFAGARRPEQMKMRLDARDLNNKEADGKKKNNGGTTKTIFQMN